MKNLMILIIFITVCTLGISQNKIRIDSLNLVLAKATTDSARFNLHFNIYREFIEFNNDSALHHVEQQIAIADLNNMKLALADALETKGYVLQRFGRFKESLETLNHAMEIANNPKNEVQNWYPDSMGSPHVFRIRVLGFIQLDMGHVMGSINEIDKQLAHYKEAIRLANETKNHELSGIVHLNLGYVYFYNYNELDTAIQMQEIALNSFQKAGHTKWLNAVYGAIGDIYQRKNENKLAVAYFHKAINASYDVNNLENVFWSLHSLIDHYNIVQIRDSSMHYAYKMGDLIRNHPSSLPKNAGELYTLLLAKTYHLNNQADSAYTYLNLAYSLKDSTYQSQLQNLTEVQNLSFETKIKAEKLEKEKTALQNRVRLFSLLIGLVIVLIIAFILYRNNIQKQKSNRMLESTLVNLKSTQAQLIHSEKMASLGELTAGIAHEIQNPLNFVNNFSSINAELIQDLKNELSEGNIEEVKSLANDIKLNSEKIITHGQRASSIVQNMLEHSRTSSGKKELSDLNLLCDEYLRLSYHGLRAKDKAFNSDYKTDLATNLHPVMINKQEIARVLLNIINNAFQAVHEKSKKLTDGSYNPLVTVKTEKEKDTVKITVSDNGMGIPETIKDKIFQPFFTTKPTGQGTGLGLSLSYDIVKAHGGTITLKSLNSPIARDIQIKDVNEIVTEFFLILPVRESM